jgi:hypothetical protein
MAKHIVTPALPTPTSTEGKCIQYDRFTKDYACFLDGEYVGHQPTYGDAETHIDYIYHEQLTRTQVNTADQEADAALPFEPTQAELAEYAKEWDAAAYEAEVYVTQFAADNAPVSERDKQIIRKLLSPVKHTHHAECDTYECGKVGLWVGASESRHPSFDFSPDNCTWSDVRNLYILLSQSHIQELMQLS